MAKNKYKTIPVDEEAYEMVNAICRAYQTSKRNKGAMVKKLVLVEFESLISQKLVPVEDIRRVMSFKKVNEV